MSAAYANRASGGAQRLREDNPDELARMRQAQAEWLRERGRLVEAQELEREPLQ